MLAEPLRIIDKINKIGALARAGRTATVSTAQAGSGE
jgi:hypothetical protein